VTMLLLPFLFTFLFICFLAFGAVMIIFCLIRKFTMFAYKLIDGTSQLWPHALRIMNMTFVVQFNVYVCLIEVDRYISHTEDMFLDIHFRINDWKMFRYLRNAKFCFCALNELL
jgi:hypothetical protein